VLKSNANLNLVALRFHNKLLRNSIFNSSLKVDILNLGNLKQKILDRDLIISESFKKYLFEPIFSAG